MKFTSILAIASVWQMGAAFSPSFQQRASSSSERKMIDPSQLSDVVQHVDAVRVVFMECNDDGCAVAEAVKAGGGWHVNGGLEHGAAGEVRKVLMMEMEDTE